MPSRRQIKAAKKRKLNEGLRQAEERRLAEGAKRLKTMSTSFTMTYGSREGRKEAVGNKKSVLTLGVFRRETPNYPSLKVQDTVSANTLIKHQMSKEMIEREAKAQEEISKKKRRVAILFNKGGYQYITDETDLTTLGRK